VENEAKERVEKPKDELVVVIYGQSKPILVVSVYLSSILV
jgi:hypothetical protein